MPEEQEIPDPAAAEAQAEAARAKEAEAAAKEAEAQARKAEAERIEREEMIKAENELREYRNKERYKRNLRPLLDMTDEEAEEFLADEQRVKRARAWLEEKGKRTKDFVDWFEGEQSAVDTELLGRGTYEDDPFRYELEKTRAEKRYKINRDRTLSEAQKATQRMGADFDTLSARFAGSTPIHLGKSAGRLFTDPTLSYKLARGPNAKFLSGRGMLGLAAGGMTLGTDIQLAGNTLGRIFGEDNPFTKEDHYLNFSTPKEGGMQTLGSVFTEGLFSLYRAKEKTPDQRAARGLGLDPKDYAHLKDQLLAGRAMNEKTGIGAKDMNERITGKSASGEQLSYPEGYGKLEVLPDFSFGPPKDGKPSDPKRRETNMRQAEYLYQMPAQDFYNSVVKMRDIKLKEQAEKEAALAPEDRKTTKEKPVDQSLFPYPFKTVREVTLSSGAKANIRYRPFVYKAKSTSKAHIVNIPINLSDLQTASEEELRQFRAPIENFSDDMQIDTSE